jgi:putative transcriptional regulator
MAGEAFKKIAAGLKEAVAHSKGRKTGAIAHQVRIADIDVRALRGRLGMSQMEFAAAFKFSPATVRNWEQKRRQPEGPAKVLLKIIEREPNAVKRALRS